MGNIRVLDASQDTNQPIRKLDFITMAGTTGKLAMSAVDACAVKKMPPTRQAKETTVEANGPLRAKSRTAALFDGNDFSGVMHPNSPSCGEGSGVGNPILIPFIFATK
jgi:hypothetical protein